MSATITVIIIIHLQFPPCHPIVKPSSLSCVSLKVY